MINLRVKNTYEELGQKVIEGNLDIGSAGIISPEPYKAFADYRTMTELRHLKMNIDFENKKLLDIGCGPGRLSFEFANFCTEVVGVDFSSTFINYATSRKEKENIKNISFYQSAAQDFNYHYKFDIVFLGGVLLYLNKKDCKSLIQHIKENLLKENGLLVIREPISFTKEIESDFDVKRTMSTFLELFDNSKFSAKYIKETYLLCPAYRLYVKMSASTRDSLWGATFFKIVFRLNYLIDPILLYFADWYKKYFAKNWTIKQFFFVFTPAEK